MIYSVLQEREALERKAIIKLIGLLLFQTPPMSEREVEFLKKLCAFAALDDDDMTAVMRIDIRDEWDFSYVIDDVLTLGSQKLLYFLAKLVESCFEPKSGLTSFMGSKSFIGSKEVSSFIEERIAPHLHLGDKAKANIASTADDFFTASCNAYDAVYEATLSKKELEEIAPSEKVFMLNLMKLSELSNKEAGHFLSVFSHHVLEKHRASTNEAEAMFLNHVLGAFYEQAEITPEEVGQASLKSVINLDKQWLKHLILLASLAKFEGDDNPMKDPDIMKMSRMLAVGAKTIEKRLCPAAITYKAACVAAFECLHEARKGDYAGYDTATDYLQKAVFIADIATDFVPGVAVVKKFYKHTQTAMRVVDDVTCDAERAMEKTFGLRPLVSDPDAKVINICIDGFMSESTKGQFSDWKEAFKTLAAEGAIMGFAWPSSNHATAGLTAWYDSVKNASVYGAKLAEDIKLIKLANPALDINLYGHSLGSLIIHNTLISLIGSECKVKQAYLFGGAVSRTNKHSWAGALQSVEKGIYNFYSSRDVVLKNLYRMAQVGDEPVGLGKIEFFTSKGAERCAVVNLDVSHIVGGHTEYKSKLVDVLDALQAEPA